MIISKLILNKQGGIIGKNIFFSNSLSITRLNYFPPSNRTYRRRLLASVRTVSALFFTLGQIAVGPFVRTVRAMWLPVADVRHVDAAVCRVWTHPLTRHAPVKQRPRDILQIRSIDDDL